jgi:hypothetical protein
MTAFFAFDSFSRSGTLAARWLTLAFVVVAMTTPDCCLTGRHVFGQGMDAFGPICRAARS